MTEFEQQQIEQLKRIADILEDANGEIIRMGASLEKLSDCVGYVPLTCFQAEGYNVLRIVGSVDTE